jgi:Sec-independent protein translocase protein TatA
MAKDSQGKVEEILKELGKKIDHLISETKDASSDVRDEVEKKIEELKVKKDKLEEDFKEYKQQEKWQDAKSHFSSALQELKKAIEAMFAKKEE